MQADGFAMRPPFHAATLAAEAVAGGLVVAAIIATSLLGQRVLWSEQGMQTAVALVSGLGLALVLLASAHALHANPLLSLARRYGGAGASPANEPSLALRTAAQCAGACAGVVATQASFNLDPVQAMSPVGDFWACAASELAASLALCVAYLAWSRRTALIAMAAGATLAAVCALAPALAFGNPAATVARSLSAGPLGLPAAEAALILALQIAGGAGAIWVMSRVTGEAPAHR